MLILLSVACRSRVTFLILQVRFYVKLSSYLNFISTNTVFTATVYQHQLSMPSLWAEVS